MEAEIRSLVSKAVGLPYGFAKADLLKEAVRLADLAHHKELQWSTRMSYVGAATFAGLDAEQVVTFTWLLNHAEEYGEHCNTQLIWPYKWVLGTVIGFPEFSRDQVEFFFKDSRERYAEFGFNSRPIDFTETDYCLQKGEFERARDLLKQGSQLPRDDNADCRACEPSANARSWFVLGDLDEATRLYEGMVQARLSCEEEPIRAHCVASLVYAAQERWDDALSAHQNGYRHLGRTDNLASLSSFSLPYKLAANRLGDARAIFDKFLPPMLRSRNKTSVIGFLQGGAILAARTLEKGNTTLPLRNGHLLPVPGNPEEGVVEAEPMREWLTAEANKLARMFDERNQTTHLQAILKQDWPYPLFP